MSQGGTYRDSHSAEGKGEQYDSYYETEPWQAFMWRREQACIDELLADHFANKEIRLLDFACGSGRITSFLESRVASCVGVDVSDSMLERARMKLERTELIKADLTQENPLQGRKFDLVTAFRFFTNAEDELRSKVMNTLPQYLDEGGYLLFNNHHIPEAMFFRAQRLISRVRGRKLDSNVRMMSMDETLRLIEAAGLRPVEMKRVGFLHLPRFNPPQSLVDAAESMALKIGPLARSCESVMILCQR